jgi:hypothetical protein
MARDASIENHTSAGTRRLPFKRIERHRRERQESVICPLDGVKTAGVAAKQLPPRHPKLEEGLIA